MSEKTDRISIHCLCLRHGLNSKGPSLWIDNEAPIQFTVVLQSRHVCTYQLQCFVCLFVCLFSFLIKNFLINKHCLTDKHRIQRSLRGHTYIEEQHTFITYCRRDGHSKVIAVIYLWPVSNQWT